MDYLSAGTNLDDRYEILSRLGEGTTGVVYKARHLLMNRTVAVKMLHSRLSNNPQMLKRFQQEAKAASNLDHPNIVKVFDFAALPAGEGYLVMDFLDGSSLMEEIKEKGALSVPRSLAIFVQCCSGLSYAHSRGIVHRDIKPGNILLTGGAEGQCLVKLVDFGIAKIFDLDGGEARRLTQTGEIFGSPIYMSPEQAFGQEVDARSDIYSLGCVMYECLTGCAPHIGATTAEIVAKHRNEQPAAFKAASSHRPVPGWLEDLVFKMLEKDAGARPQSVDEVKSALEKGAAGIAGATSWRSGHEMKRRTGGSASRKFPAWLAVVALTLLAVASVAVFLMYTDPGVLFMSRLELSLAELTIPREDPSLLVPMKRLLLCYQRQGRYSDAIAQAQQMLSLIKSHRSENFYDELVFLGEFGARPEVDGRLGIGHAFLTELVSVLEVKLYSGRVDDRNAAELWRVDSELLAKLPDIDKEKILRAKRSAAQCYWSIGNREKAIAYLKSVVDALRTWQHLDDINLLGSIVQLGDFYKEGGDDQVAEKLFLRALHIYPSTFGESGPHCETTANLYFHLADFYYVRGRLPEARGWAEKSLAVCRKREPVDYGELAGALFEIGRITRQQNDLAATERYLKEAVKICGEHELNKHKQLCVQGLHDFAAFLSALGRHKEAKPYFEELLVQQEKLPGDQTHEIAVDKRDYGLCLMSLKDNTAAEKYLDESYQLLANAKNTNQHDIVNLLHTRGYFYIETGRYAKAELLLRQALAICDNDQFPSQIERSLCLIYLSQVLGEKGQAAEARKTHLRGKEIEKRANGWVARKPVQ